MTRKIVRKALDDLKVSEAAFSKVMRYIGEIPQGELMQLIRYYNPKNPKSGLKISEDTPTPEIVDLDDDAEVKTDS